MIVIKIYRNIHVFADQIAQNEADTHKKYRNKASAECKAPANNETMKQRKHAFARWNLI